jgi:hypothetical protein
MRRVSAEKRPRPFSLHEQAENERPLAVKRERKQSKVFQGLIEKEPVTKSPFRRIQADLTPGRDPQREPISQPEFSPQKLLPSTALRVTPNSTPTKSALVSKRLHGPRLSGASRQKRIARKTVTWNEDCDVVEFDRESESESERIFEDSVDDYGLDELDGDDPEDNLFFQTPPSLAYSDDSYENSQEINIDPETSIAGLVDAMLGSRTTTPEPNDSFPPDMETEDGVPLGRSHHAERNAERQGQPLPSPPGSPFAHRPEDDKEPSTPPLQALSSPPSSPPLGRTTHAERAQAARNEERQDDRPVGVLPPSPSPMKKRPSDHEYDDDEFIPKLDLGTAKDFSIVEHSTGKEAVLSATETFASFCSELETSTGTELDPENSHMSFSSCHERSLSHEQRHSSPSPHKRTHRRVASIAPLSPKPRSAQGSPSTSRDSPLSSHGAQFGSPSHRVTSPLGRPSPSFARANSPGSPLNRSGSPLIHGRASSPLVASRSGTASPCPRLDREELKRRMLRRQSQSQEDLRGRSTPSAAEASFDLDADRDIFGRDEDSFVTPDNSRIDSDIVKEVENATIETVTVEKLATGTVAVSALEVSASYESTHDVGDMEVDEHEDESHDGDVLAQAARQFVTEANKSRSPRAEASPSRSTVPPPLEPGTTDTERKGSSFEGLNIDFGGRFGVAGLDGGHEGSRSTRASVGDMDVDMEMQSALDRLMEDVAGGNVQPDETFNNRLSRSYVSEAFKSPPMSRTVSGTSVAITPPPVPEKTHSQMQVKDTRKLREEFLANRRNARRAQADESIDPDEPTQSTGRAC